MQNLSINPEANHSIHNANDLITINYDNRRGYSDKSLKSAIFYIGEFLRNRYFIRENYHKFIKVSNFNDDINNCIDLDFKMPQIEFSHRARNKGGDILDITIKTRNKPGPENESEFEKLIRKGHNVDSNIKFLYFYCFFDVNKKEISRFIIFDLKKLIQLDEFKNRKLFYYNEDRLNQKDGGSYFNCITIDTLKEVKCLLQDYSKQKPDSANSLYICEGIKTPMKGKNQI
jgi:hypothetical protein